MLFPDPSQWRSFDTFERDVCRLPEEKARGDAFEAFVAAYLELTPEFALTDVWRLADGSGEVLKALGLSWTDIGVDFIAQRRDGSLWAGQAKFRSDRAPVPWRKLSTFIGAGVRARFRLLITNSIDLPRHRPTHLDDKGFGAVLLPDLQANRLLRTLPTVPAVEGASCCGPQGEQPKAAPRALRATWRSGDRSPWER
jgi:hypothetical protein